MACLNRRGEVELVGRRFGVICMNVDAVVVGAGSEETARLRPAEGVDASVVTFKLVYDIEIIDPFPVAVY